MLHIGCLLSLLLFQDPNSDLYVQEKFRVEFVLLDVVAMDKKGNLITDLKASDFEVKENKKKVDVTYFDTLDYRNGAVPDVSSVPEAFKEQVIESSTQQIVLAIDLLRVNLTDAHKIFANLNQFISSLDREQEYRINVYSMERGSITSGFTSSLDHVTDSLAKLQQRHADMLDRQRGGSHGNQLLLSEGGNPNYRSQKRSQLTDEFGFRDLESAFRECIQFYPGSESYRCINETLSHFMEVQQDRTNQVIGQLEILTYAFEESNGLKTMMFISPGFGLNFMTSAVDLANAYKYGDKTAFLDAGIAKLNPENDFRRVIHACIKNRVIFNTFDIFNANEAFSRSVGVENKGIPSAGIRRAYSSFTSDIQDGLRSLAKESGGTFYQASRLSGVMTKSLDRSRYFYVIGYNSPSSSKPGKFRKIKIKIKRKGVKARHRSGYFGG